jgi:hypothetical protein
VAPRNATTSKRTGKRFYTWRNENYWSVTTILQAVPKPALINWAKKFTAEYACDNFDQLQALLAPRHDGSVDRDGAVDWLKGAAFRDRDRKAEIGSRIHAACEAYVLGQPFPEWPITIRPQMLAFERFLLDYQPTFEATEAGVYNRSERYAGTLDGILTFENDGGRRLVGDYKSGKAIYPEVALQLAAYRFAEFIGLADGSEGPMPDVDGAFALHLPAEGGTYEVLDVRADLDVFRSFLYFREAFRWMDESSKTVLLGPLEVGGSEAERAFRDAVTT